jgi:hypothetical protein
MKFRFTVEVDIDFDLECDGKVSTEAESIDSDVVGQTIVKVLTERHDDDTVQDLLNEISNNTGWCINSLRWNIPSAECVDYLD